VLPVGDSLWAVGQFGILKQTGDGVALTALATLPDAGRLGVQTENEAQTNFGIVAKNGYLRRSGNGRCHRTPALSG